MKTVKRWMGIAAIVAAGATRAKGSERCRGTGARTGSGSAATGPQKPLARRANRVARCGRQVREQVRDMLRASEDEYRSGQSAIDRRDFERAIRLFDRVINEKSTRADGAMYWKAYSLYKLGRKPDAQTVLADLEKQFPADRMAERCACPGRGGPSLQRAAQFT